MAVDASNVVVVVVLSHVAMVVMVVLFVIVAVAVQVVFFCLGAGCDFILSGLRFALQGLELRASALRCVVLGFKYAVDSLKSADHPKD